MVRLLVLFVLLWCPVQAQAQPPSWLQAQAFLKDGAAQLSIEQAAASAFQPYEGNLGMGFQAGAIWTRLTLAPGAGAQESPHKLVVRIGPNNLEQIELYTPLEAGWQRQVRGLLTPQASRDCPDDQHCFVIDPPAVGEATVYLRIRHRGFLVAQIDVLPVDALPAAVVKRIRGITASMVVALGMLALGIVFLLIDRSVLLLVYCAFELTVVLFIASNAGLLAAVLPGVSGELLVTINSLLYVLRVGMTCAVAWAVLKPHQPSLHFLRGVWVLLLLCGVHGLLVVTGHMQLGLKGSVVVFSVLPFWQLYGIWSARKLPVSQRRVLTAGTLVYLLMVMLGLWLSFTDRPFLPQVGLVKQIVDWRLNGFAIGVLSFWIIMLERSAHNRARAQEVEALRNQAQEARTRQAELDERSALIDMLTHELKNPLGTIRFALASLRQQVRGSREGLMRIQNIDASARRMDDLIERVANFSKIERATPTDSPPVLDAAGLIQELLADMPEPEQWVLQVEAGATFRCDRQLLWVILDNLMTNASKYALPSHPIHIEVRMHNDTPSPPDPAPQGGSAARRARFEISNHVDRACMPEAASLFDRYYRHPNVQNKAGMGLGLSVVKSAAQKIHGQVAFRQTQDQVVFTLTVPA